jgi:protein disulfide-isomerase
MRSIIYSLLSLATFASTLAADTPSAQATAKKDDWDDKTPDTIFNGETVPPMIELGPATIDTEISKGNWYGSNNTSSKKHTDILAG